MGWKSIARDIAAAQRRVERDVTRRRRELLARASLESKLALQQQARLAVETYDNYLEVLLSMHKDCGPSWHWEDLANAVAPSAPVPTQQNELAARAMLEAYRPSWFARLFGIAKRARQRLEDELQASIARDAQVNDRQTANHREAVESTDSLRKLARRILDDDLAAFQEALREIDPFSEIKALGSGIEVAMISPRVAQATLHVIGEDIVPKESVALLKSGKLSTKALPKSRFYEIYQDYVCGAIIRVARELLAALPVEYVIGTAVGTVLNSSNGHLENCPVLSLAVPRETIQRLNFDAMDPSDSLKNFVHNMKYQKTRGFQAVEPIDTPAFVAGLRPKDDSRSIYS